MITYYSKLSIGFSLMFVLLGNSFSLLASNDDCQNAVSITPANNCETITGSFAGSSFSGNLPTCAASSSQDVWYYFTASEKTMSISLGATSGLNHGFEIWTESCSGNIITCVNNSGFGNAEYYISNSFEIGKTYYIRVFNANSLPVSLSFTICVQQYASPANDVCSNATVLNTSETCNYVTATFKGADREMAAPTCFANSTQDIWYRFTASDSTMIIQLEAVAGVNHGIELIDDSCRGNVISCVNSYPSGNSESLLRHDFVIGRQYYLRIFNAGTSISTGSFGVCVRSLSAPVNNGCDGALLLNPEISCQISTISFGGSNMSGSLPECANQASQDIWYKFVANNKTMSVTLSATGGLNHGFELYRNSCSGELIRCVNNSTSGVGEFYLSNNLTVGDTYYIRVFNVNPAYFTGNSGICVQYYPIPENDQCSGATELIPSDTCFGRTISFGSSTLEGRAPVCGNSATQDIWFKFTASQRQMGINLSAASNVNHGFEVYKDSCSGNLIACLNTGASGISETLFEEAFIPGKTYYIRVFNVGGEFSTVPFTICVQQYAPPANDHCNNARIVLPSASCTFNTASFSGASVILATEPGCVQQSKQDIWFKFRATDSTMNILLASTAGLNHAFEIIQGGCSGTVVACVNDGSSGIKESLSAKLFVPGEDYLLRLLNVSLNLSKTSFNYCVYGDVSPCTPSVAITADDTSVCVGTSVTFTASAINEGLLPKYQWKVNGQNKGYDSPSFILEDPINGDQVSCELLSSEACSGGTSVSSPVITVSVERPVESEFSAQGPYCIGTVFELPGESINGISGIWVPAINSETTTSYTFIPGKGQCANFTNMTVEILPKVVPAFETPFSFCEGAPVELPLKSENDITGYWEPISGDTTGKAYIFTPDSGQCAASLSIEIQRVQIDTRVVTEEYSIVALAENASFQWLDCSNSFLPVEGAISATFETHDLRPYAVEVTQSGCVDTSICVIIITDGIGKFSTEEVQVYPNPLTDRLYIQTTTQLSDARYMIYSLTGNLLMQGDLNSDLTVVDTRILPTGIFFVKTSFGAQVMKIVRY